MCVCELTGPLLGVVLQEYETIVVFKNLTKKNKLKREGLND